MRLVWAAISLIGYASDDKPTHELHLVSVDQLGTSQEALCGTSPRCGSKWLELEGPSRAPCCLACARERGDVALRKVRRRKLQLLKGGMS